MLPTEFNLSTNSFNIMYVIARIDLMERLANTGLVILPIWPKFHWSLGTQLEVHTKVQEQLQFKYAVKVLDRINVIQQFQNLWRWH